MDANWCLTLLARQIDIVESVTILDISIGKPASSGRGNSHKEDGASGGRGGHFIRRAPETKTMAMGGGSLGRLQGAPRSCLEVTPHLWDRCWW